MRPIQTHTHTHFPFIRLWMKRFRSKHSICATAFGPYNLRAYAICLSPQNFPEPLRAGTQKRAKLKITHKMVGNSMARHLGITSVRVIFNSKEKWLFVCTFASNSAPLASFCSHLLKRLPFSFRLSEGAHTFVSSFTSIFGIFDSIVPWKLCQSRKVASAHKMPALQARQVDSFETIKKSHVNSHLENDFLLEPR